MLEQKIKTIIVDDEPLARERIESLLTGDSDIEIVALCNSGKKAVKAIRSADPDLLFLDIQMPELSGFEVIQKIGIEHLPVTIFVTAFDQYAVKAFESHALDYLLKPFDQERFFTSLRRAKKQIMTNQSQVFGSKILSLMRNNQKAEEKIPYQKKIAIKSSGRYYFLEVENIDWIEAAGNYVNLHTRSDEHLLRETMNGIGKKIDPHIFIRIHRSYYVNSARIKEIQPSFNKEFIIVLTSGKELPSSRNYSKNIHAFIENSSL